MRWGTPSTSTMRAQGSWPTVRHLGQEQAAHSVDSAVQKVLYEAKTVSPDLGGKAKTAEVGDAIVGALGAPAR